MTAAHLPVDLTPIRATPGALPPDGVTSVAGIAVPAGRALPMQGVGEAAIWAAPEHLEQPRDTVTALQAAFPETGLWPILTYGRGEVAYPWGEPAEFWSGPSGIPVSDDGAAILYARWRANYGDDLDLDEWREPLRPWPGILTPESPGTIDDVTPVGGPQAWREEGQLVLVPAARPADVFLTLGPSAFNDRPGHEESTAVLRSWEDRYGAVPLRFSGDRLDLGLRRPPRTTTETRALAIEMMAFSGDAFNSVEWDELFETMRGERLIMFWWD